MATQLVDPFGFPVNSRQLSLHDATRNSGERPSWPVLTGGIHEHTSYFDHRVMLSAARRLWVNNDVLKGATFQKAMHAIGRAWEPEFVGEHKEWGDGATKWLSDEWYKIGNTAGENFDFKTWLYLCSVSIDRDGETGTLLTETATGYPQIQSIPAHRIGVRNNERVVAAGPYKGMRIESGAILSGTGRAIAFRVLGSTAAQDQDISADDLIVKFDPEWMDQRRGQSAFTGSINALRDSIQSESWELRAQLMASAFGLVEHNESGSFDPSDPSAALDGVAAETTGFSTQTLEGGLIRYFKAGTGSKIESIGSDRPGETWENFQDRVIRKALMGMSWPYSLCWKPDGQNGTQERAEIEKARASIKDRQDLLETMACRVVGYAVSKAINLKIIPPYPGKDLGGFLKWKFTFPPLFSIDNGRDGQSRREDYKLGHLNTKHILAERGEKLIPHLYERAHEIADAKLIAEEVSKARNIKIEPWEMCMMGPNQVPAGINPDAIKPTVAAP